MNPEVFAATLKQDVITAFGPRRRKSSVNNRTSMALAPKFWMSNDIFEKPVLSPGSQEIWRSNKHAGRNDLGVHGGYENRHAFVRQHFQPDFFSSLFRFRAGAYF
jgi:hypothetical protein